MFVHVQVETVTEYAIGSVIRPVRCERCQAQYFYELARLTKGTGTTVYGIGQKAARKRARKSAEKKLARQQLMDREAVPCPTCNWIQSGMAGELRARRHAWMSWIGYACCIGAAVIALFYFLFQWTEPKIADWIARNLSTPGITLLVVGIALNLLRAVRARAFDPNDRRAGEGSFDASGSPPALLDDAGGQLFAPQQETCVGANDGSIVVQLPRAIGAIPQVCCACLGHAEKQSKPAFCDTALVAFPICKNCLGAWNWRTSKRVLGVIWIAAVIGAAVATAIPDLKTGARIGWGVGATAALSIIVGVVAVRYSRSELRGRWIDRRRGVIMLTFLNQQYSHMFAERYRARLPGPGTHIVPLEPP